MSTRNNSRQSGSEKLLPSPVRPRSRPGPATFGAVRRVLQNFSYFGCDTAPHWWRDFLARAARLAPPHWQDFDAALARLGRTGFGIAWEGGAARTPIQARALVR
jgi:hypothetical protein